MKNFHEMPQDYVDYKKYNNTEDQIDIFEEEINLQEKDCKKVELNVSIPENELTYDGPQYYTFEVFKIDNHQRVVLDHIVAKNPKEACQILDKTKYKNDDRVSISKLSPCDPPLEALKKQQKKMAMKKNKHEKEENLRTKVEQFQKRKDIFG